MLSILRAFLGSSANTFKYEDDLVRFTLPGKWTTEQEPSVRVSLVNSEQSARFVVSLLKVREPMTSRETRLQQIEALASVRRQELDKLSSGQVKIGEPHVVDVGDKLIYDFMVKSLDPEVQMYFRFLQRREFIATFSLYDTSGQAAEAHLELLREAFSSTSIK